MQINGETTKKTKLIGNPALSTTTPLSLPQKSLYRQSKNIDCLIIGGTFRSCSIGNISKDSESFPNLNFQAHTHPVCLQLRSIRLETGCDPEVVEAEETASRERDVDLLTHLQQEPSAVDAPVDR